MIQLQQVEKRALKLLYLGGFGLDAEDLLVLVKLRNLLLKGALLGL